MLIKEWGLMADRNELIERLSDSGYYRLSGNGCNFKRNGFLYGAFHAERSIHQSYRRNLAHCANPFACAWLSRNFHSLLRGVPFLL